MKVPPSKGGHHQNDEDASPHHRQLLAQRPVRLRNKSRSTLVSNWPRATEQQNVFLLAGVSVILIFKSAVTESISSLETQW